MFYCTENRRNERRKKRNISRHINIQSAKNVHILFLERKKIKAFQFAWMFSLFFFYSQFKTTEMDRCALSCTLFETLVYVSLVIFCVIVFCVGGGDGDRDRNCGGVVVVVAIYDI